MRYTIVVLKTLSFFIFLILFSCNDKMEDELNLKNKYLGKWQGHINYAYSFSDGTKVMGSKYFSLNIDNDNFKIHLDDNYIGLYDEAILYLRWNYKEKTNEFQLIKDNNSILDTVNYQVILNERIVQRWTYEDFKVVKNPSTNEYTYAYATEEWFLDLIYWK